MTSELRPECSLSQTSDNLGKSVLISKKNKCKSRLGSSRPQRRPVVKEERQRSQNTQDLADN